MRILNVPCSAFNSFCSAGSRVERIASFASSRKVRSASSSRGNTRRPSRDGAHPSASRIDGYSERTSQCQTFSNTPTSSARVSAPAKRRAGSGSGSECRAFRYSETKSASRLVPLPRTITS